MKPLRKLRKSWKFDKGMLISAEGEEADVTENLRMQMSTRHFGKTYSTSVPNHINAMVVIDTFQRRKPSNSRPM
jgi:hypothetical protein